MLSKAIIRYVLRDTLNLQILPSKIAAVSLILAINIALSCVKKHIDLHIQYLSGLERVCCGGTFFFKDQWNSDVAAQSALDPENPIQMWTPTI